MDWSAQQYLKFEDERTRPIRDLLAAVPTAKADRVADIGCGPGNSTEILAARYPGAAVIGVDNSPDMIAAAKKRLPHIHFKEASIEEWSEPEPLGVILSNAALQWVPNHEMLMPRLVSLLEPGGSLAVQMPDNLQEPSQVALRSVAESQPFAAKLGAAAKGRDALPRPEWYYSLLCTHAARVDVWRTTYHHPLQGPKAIVEWFKGSSLRPLLARLDAKQQEDYLARYTDAVSEAYPTLADGTVLLPFPRLFIVATR
jgi:trans-aconitate 2-methyltransferase